MFVLWYNFMYILIDSIELRYIEKERKIGEKSLFLNLRKKQTREVLRFFNQNVSKTRTIMHHSLFINI